MEANSSNGLLHKQSVPSSAGDTKELLAPVKKFLDAFRTDESRKESQNLNPRLHALPLTFAFCKAQHALPREGHEAAVVESEIQQNRSAIKLGEKRSLLQSAASPNSLGRRRKRSHAPSPAISFRYKDPHLVDDIPYNANFNRYSVDALESELPEIKASSVSGYSEIGPIGMSFPGL